VPGLDALGEEMQGKGERQGCMSCTKSGTTLSEAMNKRDGMMPVAKNAKREYSYKLIITYFLRKAITQLSVSQPRNT
jgi:hypothetical protein